MTLEKAMFYYNNYYCNGYSTIDLSNKFGHEPQYYIHGFNQHNLALRSNKINSRKYYADFDYFENIDSAEKAYWLGFIYADGYVSKTSSSGKKFGIALSVKDMTHLQKFASAINATYPIKVYKQNHGYNNRTDYCRLIISSDKLFDDLTDHGVLEHKTDILKAPDIDPEYYNQFILGYFDGDGSICLNHQRSPFYNVSFVGTDAILSFIHSQFRENGVTNRDITIAKRKPGQKVSYIRYGGNGIVPKIYKYMYHNIDSAIPLERKRELLLKCCNRIFE